MDGQMNEQTQQKTFKRNAVTLHKEEENAQGTHWNLQTQHNGNYQLPMVLFLVKAMLSVEISLVPKLQVMAPETNLTLPKPSQVVLLSGPNSYSRMYPRDGFSRAYRHTYCEGVSQGTPVNRKRWALPGR